MIAKGDVGKGNVSWKNGNGTVFVNYSMQGYLFYGIKQKMWIMTQPTNQDIYTDGERSVSLDTYVKEIAHQPLVSKNEEIELAKRIRQGDKAALDKLVVSNLRFVVSIARQYKNYGLSLEDLINEGNLGLIEAAYRFDETKGYKFISYAVWWIRQSILQALAETNRMIRIPLNRIGDLSKINAIFYSLEQKYGREPTEEELGEALNMSPQKVKEAMAYNYRNVSIDTPIETEEDDEEMTLLDQIENKNAEKPTKYLSNEDLKVELEQTLACLPEKEAEVLRLYYGINMKESVALTDIAQQLDLTEERIRQLRASGLRRITKLAKMDTLRTYLS